MFWDFLFLLAGGAYAGRAALSESAENARVERFLSNKGYNRDRQWELERMIHHIDPQVRAEFDRMVGHPFNRDSRIEKRKAVEEIAKREGWTYFDISECEREMRELGIRNPNNKGRY